MSQATEQIARQYANGAANKNIWSKIIFNVKEYGADGDDVNDDTLPIQAAINAAGAVGGGKVILPSGTFKITDSLIINSSNVTLEGSGVGATVIKQYNTAKDTIVVGNPFQLRHSVIRDLTISASAFTGSAGVKYTTVVRSIIENVEIDHHLYALDFKPYVFDIWCSKLNLLDVSQFGAAIRIDVGVQGGGIFINGSTIDCGSQVGTYGIMMTTASGCFITDVDIRNAQKDGIIVNPGEGQSVGANWFTNVLGDTCGENGIHIAPTGNGDCSGLLFQGCWGSYCNNNAILLDGTGTIQEIEFANCKAQFANFKGISIQKGTNISIMGGNVTGNSRTTPNTNAGIEVGPGVSGFKIIGVRVGATYSGAVTQNVGIVTQGTSNNYMITNNDLRGNTTALSDGASGVNKVVANNLS